MEVSHYSSILEDLLEIALDIKWILCLDSRRSTQKHL